MIEEGSKRGKALVEKRQLFMEMSECERSLFFGVVGGGGGDGGALSTSLLPLKCRREGLNALPGLANVPYSVLTRERHSVFFLSFFEYV